MSNKGITVRLEFLTVVLLRVQVFWDMTQCYWESGYWYF